MAHAVRLRRDIESVLHLARRMVGRNVQLGEIVIVEFHIRAFGDAKAKVGEDRDHFVQNLADGMDTAGILAAGGQRDVQRFRHKARIQRRIGQLALALRDRLGDGVFQAVELWALHLALFGVQLAHGGQQRADRALLAQRADAHGFQRRFIGSGGYLRQYVGLKGGDIAHANSEGEISRGRLRPAICSDGV